MLHQHGRPGPRLTDLVRDPIRQARDALYASGSNVIRRDVGRLAGWLVWPVGSEIAKGCRMCRLDCWEPAWRGRVVRARAWRWVVWPPCGWLAAGTKAVHCGRRGAWVRAGSIAACLPARARWQLGSHAVGAEAWLGGGGSRSDVAGQGGAGRGARRFQNAARGVRARGRWMCWTVPGTCCVRLIAAGRARVAASSELGRPGPLRRRSPRPVQAPRTRGRALSSMQRGGGDTDTAVQTDHPTHSDTNTAAGCADAPRQGGCSFGDQRAAA